MKQYLFPFFRSVLLLCTAVFLLHPVAAVAQNIITVAGNGTGGYTSDGISAVTSELHNPTTIAKDAAGNLYIADYNNARVRMVNTSGIISTVAGTGVAGYNFDNVAATTAKINQPNGVAVDAAGNIYIAEMSGDRIRKVNTSGIITTIAGNGTPGITGDGGPATAALVNHPSNVTVDASGNVYIADWGNNEIRMINTAGYMSKIAGTGVGGYSGDGIATAQKLAAPYSVSLDALGNLYFSDENNSILRKINLSTGMLTTIAGTAGSAGFSGDGFAATSAQFNHPDGIVANAGQLYIADYSNNRIRVVNLSTGIVTTAVGNGTAGYGGDGGPATASTVEIDGPAGVLLDPSGNLYIADFTNDRVREVQFNNHPPFFDSGHVKHITVCENSSIFITPDLAITDSDVGQTETWTLYNAPAVGNIYDGAVVLGTGSSTTGTSNGGILGVTGTFEYVALTGSTSPDSFIFRVNDGISIDSEKFYVTITPAPLADAISGPTSVCVGSTINLTDDSTGGTWISKSPGIATVSGGGVVTGVTGGANDTVIYVVSNACGHDTVFTVISVLATPGPITPSGSVSVCIGNFFDLADGTPGGTWSASNSNATVGTSGVVTGYTSGVDTITYAIGACSVSKPVTVNGPVAALPRSPSVCVGGTVSLTDGTGGGGWSSASSGIASVSAGGLVTGVSTGSVAISYTVGSCSTLDTVTVISGPAPISPASGSACAGSTLNFTDATGSGTWTVSNGHATISGGLITGVSAGIDTIKYTVGTCFVTATVTVVALPAPITPAGAVSVCIGSTTTLADGTPTGTWSSAATGTATVGTGGVVSGINAGTVVISYTVGGCSSLKTVTVNGPASIAPHDPSICSGGGTVSLTDGTGGGSWSSAAPGVATVSAGGLVTGVAAGIAPISYTVGSCSTLDTVTVLAGPAAITPAGAVTVCAGATTTLVESSGGGSWSSSLPAIGTVSAGGIVTGITAGTVTISYTIGTCTAIKSVTVNGPSAISPYDPSICSGGGTVSLSDATPAGSWSSGAPGFATVSAGGLVTGVGVGIAPISYTVGGCSAIDTVFVISGPAAILPAGPVAVCTGSSVLLSDATPGGSWSSSTPGVATVSAGLVTGVVAGTATITYTQGSCYATDVVTVNSAPTPLSPSSVNICVGNVVNMTESVSGGTWSSSTPAVATVAGGTVTGLTPGTTTITYALGTCSVSATVTVSATAGAGVITGPSAVCVGSSIGLSDATPGGTWSSGTPALATVSGGGSVLGVSSGIATISYTVSNACGSVSTTTTVNVEAAGVAAIGGPGTVCAGTFATLTDATTGGTWSASNAHATVLATTGLVTGISTGADTIAYTVTNACGTSSTTKLINVGAFLTAGSISGGNSLCAGAHLTLTDPAPGGVWSSSNASASVAGGTVTGLSGGVDTISYTVTSSCGSAIATHTVTVNPLPSGGSIAGPSSLCIGTPATYTDASPGGSWSISNAHASILGTGVVTPLSAGIDTITYTVTNSCGTASTTATVTIGASTSAGIISGPGAICTGTPVTLTDAAPGGTWSASNGIATVSGAGLVSGVSAGVDTISYSVPGSCGLAVATMAVTVTVTPSAAIITGPGAVCMGSTYPYSDASPGGTWSVSNGAATISGTGLVSPVSPGTDTISYTVSNSCGTAATTKVITIGAFLTAGAIAGPTAVCVGGNITLTDGAPGGVWSTSNGTAAIGSTGVVTGLAGGVDTVSYTVTGSCGTAVATYIVGIGASATAGTITGPSAVCVSSLITLADAVPGGSWSSSNANATVAPGGVVTGIFAGTDTINYTVTGPCGVGSATYAISINSLPVAGSITGPSSVCVGDSVTLSDPVAGGVWSAANSDAFAGSASGVVTGVAGGTDVISYTVTNACGSISATQTEVINTLPDPGTVSGPDSVCAGTNISLTDAVPGGSWSAGNGNATVSGAGLVTGVSGGTDPISYSLTNGCGAASAVYLVAVLPAASGGVISGGSSVCVGSGITLTPAYTGGTWAVSNSHGLLAGPGIIDGISVGVDTVFYTVTGICGTGTSSKIITINPVPVVAPVTGPTRQCTGTVITLSDATSGGIWSSSTPAVATIGSSSGVASGIAIGTTTITYTVTNIFGCPTSVTAMDTVSLITTTPGITGPSAVCPGASITLSDALSGGSWSSSAPAVATVISGTGVVTGATAGMATISYMVTGTCGTSYVTHGITVNPLPVVAAIAGASSECPGSSITLTDATAGGTWTSGSTAVATVGSSTGIVTGVAPGTTTMMYTVTNTFGCMTTVTAANTVNTAPTVAAITGTTNECLGATTVLADATPGGTWSSSNPAVASVAGSGVVTGMGAGVVTITYSVAGTGCAGIATARDTVNTIPVPTPITGTTNVCAGGTTTLADAGFGGVWSSGNTSVATISTSGVVSGIAAGSAEIYYAIANSCGSMTDSVSVTVQLAPVAGTITGPSSVCQGATATLTDPAPGGTWSSANSHATVSGGVVTGASAGMDTIRYTVTNACSSVVATKAISVAGLPYAGSISGYTSVCAGLTIALTETVAGGAWGSNNTPVATVSGGSVTGVAPGTATISYTVTNSCGMRSATHDVTVVPADQCNTQVNPAGSPNSNEINIYPNPATDVLMIESQFRVNVRILSVSGQVVLEAQDAHSMDISKLGDAMYLVMIYDEHNLLLKTAKFAKIN